ncbi:MAG: putative LPS assembly protein LptD [Chitinophagaceae bacterium]
MKRYFCLIVTMNNNSKGNSKYIVAIALVVLLGSITLFSASNYPHTPVFYSNLTDAADTVPVIIPLKDTLPSNLKDSSLIKDTTGKLVQKVDTFDVKVSKDSLDAPVEYAATDSMVMDVPQKKIWLYNEAKVNYKDIKLNAGIINLDQGNQNVYGYYFLDTAGKRVGLPKFEQGENNMLVDTLVFNFKTQKGITKNSYTTQQEMFVHADAMKKYSANEYYAFRGTFTTCDLDTPHFAFRTKRMKLVNQKLAVTGPIHPEFEGVPIPIYLPFGFFPLSTGRHSGLLPPQFTANEQFGVGLENGGYYKVLNDYVDVMLRGDIYSYGGYRFNITPTYRVKYRYQGSLTFSYQNTRILSDFGTREFTSNRSFNLAWNHNVDSKARPGQSFSASVNAGSTKFNQYLTTNSTRNYQNQLSSSIAYSKNWNNKYNLTVTANHNQNNNTRLVSLNLPTIGFTVNTLYPLQKKEMVGTPKWYEKLGIGLNTNVANQASFYDSLFSFRRLLDTTQWGAQHSVPITIALPALGPFQISPGISYRENWYSRRIERKYNPVTDTLDNIVKKGFYRSSDVSFSLGLNTALFGLHEFKKTSHIMAIRHVMRPTVSASYNPGLASKDYYKPQINRKGDSAYNYVSYYEGSIYGSLTREKFGGLSFGLDNNLEMKVRSKTDTTDAGIKKIKLIDGFGFNGSYNFMSDSFQLSNISLYLRSTLFEKINITAGANLDPYQRDSSTGRSINKYAWTGGKFNLGKITTGNIAISTSFKSKPKDKKADSVANSAFASAQSNAAPLTLEEQQAQLSYIRNNPAEFADFNIDWSVNISYSLNFNRALASDLRSFQTIINSNLNLSGDFNLTPQWKVGMSTYYDFNGSGLQNISAFISRNLHCWQMSINVYSGYSKGFNITISPKSGLLRDLKINRSRYFYNGPY